MRKVILASAPLLFITAASQAAPVLAYKVLDGVAVIGSGSSSNGSIAVTAADSTFIVGGNATAAPSLVSPNFSTNELTTNVGASGGRVTLEITETGLTSYTGNIMNTFNLNNLTSPSFTSGTLSTYFDAFNAAYGTGTLLASTTYSSLGSFNTQASTSAIMPSIFSETVIYTLNFSSGPGGSLSASTQLVATPEPASMAILGVGLAGFGLVRHKRAIRAA